jgi:hypothetical protein
MTNEMVVQIASFSVESSSIVADVIPLDVTDADGTDGWPFTFDISLAPGSTELTEVASLFRLWEAECAELHWVLTAGDEEWLLLLSDGEACVVMLMPEAGCGTTWTGPA